MNVLVACECSGIVRDAFRAKGHDAWSCDLQECEGDPEYHLKCDARDALHFEKWDLLIAHPPCPYLSAVSSSWFVKGNRPLEEQPREIGILEAAEFFNYFMHADYIPKRCIENPRPNRFAKKFIGPHSQVIHPWMFGHPYTKATLLWLHNLPILTSTNEVKPLHPWVNSGTNTIRGGANTPKDRARTFQGIANAMAEQWG